MRKNFFQFFTFCGTILLLPQALYGATHSATNQVFRIGWQSFPPSLIYFIAYDEYSFGLSSLILEPLVRENLNTLEMEPALANQWSHSPSSLKLQLNPSARFSDGTPVLASDVCATWRSVTTSLETAIFSAQMKPLQNCIVKNSRTVEFSTKLSKTKTLRSLTELFILPESLLKKHQGSFTTLAKEMKGSGPYVLESLNWGESVALKLNSNYWDKERRNFSLPQLEYRLASEPHVQLAMLKRGALDYVYVPSAKAWEEVFQDPLIESGKIIKLRVNNSLPYSTTGIAWNTRRPLFQDRRVRLALSYLLDRDRMIHQLFYSHYVASTGIFHTLSPYHSPTNRPLPFDPAKAKALLKEAGWHINSQSGLLEKAGTKFSFELLAMSGSLRHLTLYQESLRAVGIEARLRTLDWSTYIDRSRKGDFDAVELSRGRDAEPQLLELSWGSESANHFPTLNASGYANAELDHLILKSQATHSKPELKRIFQKIDTLIAEDQPMTFLWEPTFFRVIYRNRMKVPPALAYSRWYDLFTQWEFTSTTSPELN